MLRLTILILFLCLFFCDAQDITIINSVNNNPIDNVLIFNKSGKYLGKTNIEGKISKKNIENVSDFVLAHPTIQTEAFTLSNIINDEIIVKQVREQPIPKIINTNSDKEYIVLTGFFNIYSTTNGILDNYTDGIVEYLFDRKSNEYKDHIIKEYRNFKYSDNKFENTHFINFSGISQFPILGNIHNLKSSKDYIHQLSNSKENSFLIKSNDSIYNNKEKKFLGYLLNNFHGEIIYKFTSKNIELFELSNFSKTVKLDAKHKKDNDFNNYFSTTNFYPIEIKYGDKNDIKKGVKFDSKKSIYTTNYWQNAYFSYLIDYLSQKSLYDISFMKNYK